MSSRGQVQVEVVADTSKFPAEVERELKAALKGIRLQPIEVDADFQNVEQEAKKAGSSMRESLSNAGELAGAAIAAYLVAGIGEVALAADKAGNTLVARMGVSAQEAGKFGKAAGDLYAAGFGESLDEVTDAIAKVAKTPLVNAGASANEIKAVAEQALTLSQVFGEDVSTSIQAASQLLRTGLAANATEAFDILTTGLQKTGGLSDDLLDTFVEYPTNFRAIGLTGQQALGIINQGLQAGARNTDLVADALKEFAIRAKDGLDTSAAGFKALGLNAEKATADFAAGGTKAAKVFDTVLDRLRNIKDPVEQNAAAVALFGTQAEDLGKALFSLDLTTATNGLDGLAGSTTKAGDAMQNSLQTRLDQITRSIKQDLGEALLSAITWFDENRAVAEPLAQTLGVLAGAVITLNIATKAWTLIQTAATAAQVLWNGVTAVGSGLMTVLTAAYNTARVALLLLQTGFYSAGAAVTTASAALWAQVTALAAVAAGWIRTAVQAALNTVRLVAYTVATNAVRVATIAWTAVQWLLNAALTANPIGIVIAIIVALVVAIVIAYKKSETFRSIVDGAFKAIAAAATWLWENALKPLWDGIVAGFDLVVEAAKWWWGLVQAYFTAVGDGAKLLWSWIVAAWDGIVAAFNFVVEGAANFVSMVVGFFGRLRDQAAERISALIDFVSGIPGKIVSAIGNLGSTLYNAGRAVVQGLIDGVQSMISSLKTKLSVVTDLIPDWKGPLDKDKTLLVPAGQAIMQGLQTGIDNEQQSLRQQLQGVTTSIANAPSYAGRAQGGDGAQLGTAGPGLRVWPGGAGGGLPTLVIESNGSRQSDLMVQEMSKAVRVRGGIVQKVIGKNQGGVN